MSVAILEFPGLPLPARQSLPEAAEPACSGGLRPGNPWPGLAAYDEASRDYFHGREDDATALLRLIRVAPLAVLYGKSGLGKSSLLQAGVFPCLRDAHYLPVYVRVDFSDRAPCPPLEQVARRLEEEIARARAECPTREPGEALWHFLHRRDLEIWSADNFLLTPVLVLDQFEELFSRSGSDRERIQAVFDGLADLIENRIPTTLADALGDSATRAGLDINTQPYRIVLSFREDFLPEIEGWKDKVPSLLRNRLRLLPMSREQAIAATERAGAAVLAEGVAARIVDLVAPGEKAGGVGSPDVEPVLLSLCCTRLNGQRAPDGRIDADLVASAGSDILRGFLVEALAGMPARVAEFIETQLIQGNLYRGSYPRDAALAEGLLTGEELATLTDRHHLLRIDQADGVSRIELIHDRLVGVVRQARDARRARERERKMWRAWRRGAAVGVAILAGLVGWSLHTADELSSAKGQLASTARVLDSTKDELTRTTEDLSARARRQAAQATALLLAAESQSMFSGAQAEGGDRALLQVLAADGIADGKAIVRGRLLNGWLRHRERKLMAMDDTVAALAFTADGAGIVASGPDHVLRIRDALTGQPTGAAFAGHGEWVWAVALSADGSRLVSGSEDQSLRLWDVASGRELMRARHPAGVVAVAIAPDGRRLASASRDGRLRLWDAGTGKPLASRGGPGASVAALAFDPSGRYLAAAGGDGSLRLLDARKGGDASQAFATQRGGKAHPGGVSAVAFTPDGRKLVSGGADGKLRIWAVATGRLLAAGSGHAGTVMSLAASPDGRTIVSGGWDGSLRAWSPDSGKALAPAIAAHRGGVMKVAFSPDGKSIASGGVDRTLRLWDAPFRQALGWSLAGAGPRLQTVALSPDGRHALAGSADGRLRLWDAGEGKLLRRLSEGRAGTGTTASLSADGSRIAAAGKDGMVRVWDAASGRRIAELRSGASVLSLALSPDGRRIAAGGEDKIVRLWDVATGAPIGEALAGHEGPVLSLAFSPDGQAIASGGSDRTVRLWDAATGRALAVLAGNRNPVLSLAVSPDGSRVASGSQDGSLHLWDARSGELLGAPFEGHTGGVLGLAFSPDGAYLASASWDKTVRLWDAASGQPLGAPLAGHGEVVSSVGFSPDGRHLLSAGTDGKLLRWPAPASWRQELCARLTRNMSQKEWTAWVSPDIAYQPQCPGLPVSP